jgi:AcrR family transcriptional regulator
MVRPLTKPIDEWERAIIEAASSLFIEIGYEKTSVDNIMKRVGAAKGSFYRYYDSKEAVLAAIVDAWADRYAQEVVEVLRSGELSIEQKIHGVLDIVSRMARQPEGTEAFFSSKDRTLALGLQNKMISILAPELSSALKAAQTQGEVRADDADFCALFIIHGSLGALNSYVNPSDDALARLNSIVTDILRLRDITSQSNR